MSSFRQLEGVLPDYHKFIVYIRGQSKEEIISAVSEGFSISAEKMVARRSHIPIRGTVNSLYSDWIAELKRNIDQYAWIIDRLEDDRSKIICYRKILQRLLPGVKFNMEGKSDIPEHFAGWNKAIRLPMDREREELIMLRDKIVTEHPAICMKLQDQSSDLWELPRLLDSLAPQYSFYMVLGASEDESWFYAASPEPIHYAKNHLKTAVTIAPHQRPWTNVELVKDSGLIPYLLHKNYGMEVRMVGTEKEEKSYSYKELIKGVELEPLDDNEFETKLDYIREHAKEFDLLILRGAHKINVFLAKMYKQNNPSGLIYCGLDMNSNWADLINWADEEFGYFDLIKYTDIMATSCRSVAELMTKKWQREVKCLTNGSYDFEYKREEIPFDRKENVILTVSRMGTEQKDTETLLEAFQKAEKELSGWRLRLVGTVEESFQPKIKSFFEKNPNIKDRVEFIGPVEDRKQLMEEYEKAKIFALTSIFEGGAPNVIGEALRAGCAVAVTKIDAWKDCIDDGQCGAAAEIGDAEGFAQNLIMLSRQERLKQMSEKARAYAKDFYDMEKNVDSLYLQLCEIIKRRE